MDNNSWIERFGFCLDNLKSKTRPELHRMSRNLKSAGILAIGVTFALYGLAAEAQQPKKIPHIAYLAGDSHSPSRDAFRQGLKDLGYVEGRNIVVEWRYAEDKSDRFAELATELVRLKPDVIVAANAAAVMALKRATTTIPIVIAAYGGDLVADGIVASFARPGGNITGVTPLDPELSGKQMELLKEVFPKLRRLAVMWKPDDSGSSLQWRETQSAAEKLGIELLQLSVQNSGVLEKAIESASRGRADALMVLRNVLFYVLRKRLAILTENNRLPGIYPSSEFVDDGGLMSYGSNNNVQYRRAATFVDKILKGTKPADLPIEAPTKFEFVINLKTAKQIGVTIPQSVLYRADKVIK